MRAALVLFDERGYDSTTAAAIAQRAGVTEMTFFRYFPSKDSVLIADPYDPVIAEAISRQPAQLAPLAAASSAWLSRGVPSPRLWGLRFDTDFVSSRVHPLFEVRLRGTVRQPKVRSLLR